jgi:hypothetical protein
LEKVSAEESIGVIYLYKATLTTLKDNKRLSNFMDFVGDKLFLYGSKWVTQYVENSYSDAHLHVVRVFFKTTLSYLKRLKSVNYYCCQNITLSVPFIKSLKILIINYSKTNFMLWTGNEDSIKMHKLILLNAQYLIEAILYYYSYSPISSNQFFETTQEIFTSFLNEMYDIIEGNFSVVSPHV